MPAPAQIDAARRALAVLRSMRGGAGKLAQLADFVDPDWAPPDDRAELEAHLSELRRGTLEPLPFKRVERLLRDSWGGRLSNHLAELEPEPVAAASAGQVHRGELDDGRPVAVKVLHPGIEDSLRADLGNLSLLAPLATAVMPGVDPGALLSELRDLVLVEMDLEDEAQSQRLFARAYRGHPFIHVPAPVTELARTGVLVSEWVDGTPFADVLALDAGPRERYGEILARFHVGAAFYTSSFHADPHPGNHFLQRDGKVAFVDFGSIGRAEPARLAGLLDVASAAHAGDGERFCDRLTQLGYLAEQNGGHEVDGRALLAALDTAGGSPPRVLARDVLVRHGRLPAGDLAAGRMVAGLGALLVQLRAMDGGRALGRELLRDEAASELGKAEAGFWAARGHSRNGAVHGLRRW